MYSELSDEFRQGDIIEPLYYVSPGFYRFQNEQLSLSPNINVKHAHFALLSNCCELQWYYDGNVRRPKRPYVFIAPLSFRLPFTAGTVEYDKLVRNGEGQPDNDPIQYFYYDPSDVLSSESVTDLSAMMPVRSSFLADSKKILQLDINCRHLLRIRLREYFTRIPDEEWDEVHSMFSADTI